MRRVLTSIVSLLLGIGTMLIGLGALGTLVGVRGVLEHFPAPVIGAVNSAYFCGYIGGTFLWPRVIARVGHIRTFAALAAVGSVAATLHGLFVDPWAWLLLRALMGGCVVGLYVVVESWLNALAPTPVRGAVFASYMAVSLFALYRMLAGPGLAVAEQVAFLPLLRTSHEALEMDPRTGPEAPTQSAP